MTEILTVLTVGILFAGFTYAGYIAGREASERQAAETIANLRRSVVTLRQARDRAVENNARLARHLGLHQSDRDAPDWMFW